MAQDAAPIELLGAACYQLGMLPAMASALLAQVDLSSRGAKLYASFFRGDFDMVLRQASDFWRQHPELRKADAGVRILTGEDSGGVAWYLSVEIVRCLGLISDSLRRGQRDRLKRAIDKLEKLSEFSLRSVSEDISLLIDLLFRVGRGYADASIYLVIDRMVEARPNHEKQLRAFARRQFSRGRGILWTSQKQGLERLLTHSSFALCTPTGSGKTLVANMALVKELLLGPDQLLAHLGLYLVPSRALAGEVEAKLTAELGTDIVVTGLYGGADWGITDYWLTADKPVVLIATVEKADALMRYLGPFLVSRLRLLIIDEAHQVVSEETERAREEFAAHSSRNLRLETFVSRVLSQVPDLVRIALTAVAGGAASPVARWIEGTPEAVPIGIHYRSTRQVVGMLQTVPGGAGRLLLEIVNDRPLYVRGREQPVYMNLRTPVMPQMPAAMRNSLYRFNEVNALWTALHLIEGKRRILISVMEKPEQTMRWYAEALALPGWGNLTALSELRRDSDRVRFDDARSACVDYCGEDSFEVALLDRGIATNHGQMPQRLRRLMTDLIERRICAIAVATATLTEGVNLPFDIIVACSLRRSRFIATSNPPRREVTPISAAEFRNLSGRAGRPGVSSAMEGMTLIAVPQASSATAKGTLATHRRQIEELAADYNSLLSRLLAEQREDFGAISPLGLLLKSIYDLTAELEGIDDEEGFLLWLEKALPESISGDVGLGESDPSARLADSVDELDGFLLSALQEVSAMGDALSSPVEVEAYLVKLWQKTFAKVASIQEEWLEHAFVRRGRAIVETVYPDDEERARLYRYGFTPQIGRRFEAVAAEIKEEIEGASDYGSAAPVERVKFFERIGEHLLADRGFGFRIRETKVDQALLDSWTDVLGWWMGLLDGPRPEPESLRHWQRFVAENLEFRLGTAIGAVVAQAWSAASDPFEIPSLAEWRQKSQLPWFGFWAKELLRWGTLEPFVAFALSQGLARTRAEAAERRLVFVEWLSGQIEEVDSEDLIDPQRFLEWQKSLEHVHAEAAPLQVVDAELTGTDGRGGRYAVLPLEDEDGVTWIDSSGFELARSPVRPDWLKRRPFRNDFELRIQKGRATVLPVFST